METGTKVLLTVSSLILVLRWTVVKDLDRYVRKKVMASKTEFIEKMMKHLSRLGDRDLAMGIMVLIINDKIRLSSFAAVALGMLIAQITNILVGQRRPPAVGEYNCFTNNNKYHSFVSGHATGAFAFATVLVTYFTQYSILIYTLAILVAISRLYKDKHWLSNILAGAIIGCSSAVFILSYGELIVNKFF